MLRNTLEAYSFTSRFLHWIMAILVLGLMGVGLWMVTLEPTPLKGNVYMFHKSIGLVTLGLLLFRLYWRLTNVTPALPNDLPLWQQWAARLNHGILYLYMMAMAFSGSLMSLLGSHGIDWFGLVHLALPANPTLSGQLHAIHVTLTDYIWFFLGTHIFVAFYHHYIRKDTILRRMWKGL